MAPLDHRDPAWISKGLVGMLKQRLDVGRFAWIEPPEQPTHIPNDSRVAILGDWGSGRYGAPACAASVASDPEGFDVVVHLGDIYYAGHADEIHEHFLKHWPFGATGRTRDQRPPLFRSCIGNHEMYSGGQPFVDLVLPRFAQASTAFALENDDWLFVGLDTAYDEWKLGSRQENWLRRLLARDDGRQVVLFTHHPPFSFFETISSRYYNLMRGIVRDHPGKIHAWYWGHEHLGAIYDECPELGVHGRCVGHSGFPYVRRAAVRAAERVGPTFGDADLVRLHANGRTPSALAVDGPNRYVHADEGDAERFGPNGFMTITVAGCSLHEELRAADGRVLWDSGEERANLMYQQTGSVLSYA